MVIVKEEGRVGRPARGRERGYYGLTRRRRRAPGAASGWQRETGFTNATTVLVTGGAGLIGSHFTAELLRRGLAVRVLANVSTGKRVNLAALPSAPGSPLAWLGDGLAVGRGDRGRQLRRREVAAPHRPHKVGLLGEHAGALPTLDLDHAHR